MNSIYLAANEEFPKVILDKELGIFEISGISIPHNSAEFYSPLIEWFKKYIEYPNAETVLQCKLDYFNTSTHKYLTEIFKLLDQIYKAGKKSQIAWHYAFEDEDMKLIGEEMSQFLEVPFTYQAL